MRKMWFVFIIALSSVIVLSACAAPASPPPSPTPEPTPTAPPFEMPQGSGETWQLVIISDSSLWGVGEALADRIEKDIGVTVEYVDYATGSQSARDVLDALRTGKSPSMALEKLPAILKDAEYVVVFLNYWDSIDAEHPLDMDQCFASQKPKNCDPESFAQWTADLNGIWGEILKLRSGQPTILRAVDLYNPLVQPWKDNGAFEECTRCWENMSDAARKAAEPYNIPFLSRLDEMNGVNHDEDPRLKGFILEDGEHPSDLGAQYMAGLLADMGYYPVIPPASPDSMGSPSSLKIVFSNGSCAATGPSEFPFGKLQYSWRVEETIPAQFGVISISLSDGKTLDDFREWDKKGELVPPEWITTFSIDDLKPSGGEYQFSRDLSANAAFQGKPIYLVCYRTDREQNINILGPFTFSAKE